MTLKFDLEFLLLIIVVTGVIYAGITGDHSYVTIGFLGLILIKI